MMIKYGKNIDEKLELRRLIQFPLIHDVQTDSSVILSLTSISELILRPNFLNC